MSPDSVAPEPMPRDMAATRLSRVGRWLCVSGAVIGTVGIVGWLVRLPLVTWLLPGQPRMMPNTAISLVLLGLAGAVLHDHRDRRKKRSMCIIAAIIVAAIGAATLAEYVARVDLGIDDMLVRVPAHAGRPAPATAFALTLLASAILCIDVRLKALTRPSEWLLIGGALATIVGLTGQLLGAGQLYLYPRTNSVGVAIPTALSLLFIAIGLLLVRPDAGLMAQLRAEGSGGVLIRRMALPTMLIPVLVGFVGIRLFAMARADDVPLMVAVLIVAMILLGLVRLAVTAVFLNRAYDRMVESQAQTQAIIAHASEGIFIADLDGNYTAVNSTGCELLGLREEQLIGKNIRDFLRPDEVDRLVAARARLLEGAIEVSEWHLRHATGRYIPVEASTKLLPGGIWQGLVHDISKRKEAEERAKRLQDELRDARGFLENVLQSSVAYGLIALDLERRVIFWNEGARRLFGYTADEMMGKSADVLHVRADFDTGTAPALYARALEQGSAEVTMRRRRKDGSEFISRLAVTRRQSNGSVTGYLLVSRDVTREARAAEHNALLASIGLLLTSSLERQRLVEDAVQLLVRDFADAGVVDLAEHPEAEQTTWHSVVLHRDSRKQPLTAALQQIRRDGHPPYFALAPAQTRKTTVVTHVTDEFLDALAQNDNHRRLMHALAPVSLISVPLQSRGLLLGVMTFVSSDAQRRYDEDDVRFVEDVGQRLALAVDHARLFQAEKNAVAARDEVMRVVAHDLRNPLGTIMMQASTLRSDGIPLAATAQQRGEAIERAARRMNRLIQDLLDVTQLEAGRLSVRPSAVELASFLRDAVEAQRERAAHASIDLRLDTLEELPAVWCDRDRLLQIFENLIGNATKFTRPGGSVVAGAAAHDGEVLFWVRDTGRGIAAEELPHVFERFWRRHSDKAGGAGLGLPIVKGLVEAQGGRVWAQSRVDHGSTFYFTLPVASVRARAATEKEKPAA